MFLFTPSPSTSSSSILYTLQAHIVKVIHRMNQPDHRNVVHPAHDACHPRILNDIPQWIMYQVNALVSMLREHMLELQQTCNEITQEHLRKLYTREPLLYSFHPFVIAACVLANVAHHKYYPEVSVLQHVHTTTYFEELTSHLSASPTSFPPSTASPSSLLQRFTFEDDDDVPFSEDSKVQWWHTITVQQILMMCRCWEYMDTPEALQCFLSFVHIDALDHEHLTLLNHAILCKDGRLTQLLLDHHARVCVKQSRYNNWYAVIKNQPFHNSSYKRSVYYPVLRALTKECYLQPEDVNVLQQFVEWCESVEELEDQAVLTGVEVYNIQTILSSQLPVELTTYTNLPLITIFPSAAVVHQLISYLPSDTLGRSAPFLSEQVVSYLIYHNHESVRLLDGIQQEIEQLEKWHSPRHNKRMLGLKQKLSFVEEEIHHHQQQLTADLIQHVPSVCTDVLKMVVGYV